MAEVSRSYFLRQAVSGRRVIAESDVRQAWPRHAGLEPNPTHIEGFIFTSPAAALAFDVDGLVGTADDDFESWDEALAWMRAS